MTTQTIAASISDQFRTQTRPDGSNYTTAEEGSAARELVQKIHFDVFNGMFPNDWVYEKTHALVDSIEEYDDPSDYLWEIVVSNVDIYTYDLLMWVGSNLQFMGWVDEAFSTWGTEIDSLTQAIQMGQYEALSAMASVILQFMEDAEADEEEEDDEE